MSFSPKHFSTVNMHTKVFMELLKKYSSLFNWTKNERLKIVDIGTGPGSSLLNLIRLIPQNYDEIICVETDIEMLDFFTSLKKDHRISSMQLDIQTRSLPHELKDRFDFAMSTNTFMYLHNHRQAFVNTNKMMKHGGEIFFVWSKKCDLHDVYRELSKIDKWYPYTSYFRNWNTYFDNENPISTINTVLEYSGYDALKIEEISDNVFDAENEKKFLDIYDSLDYISKRIPEYDLPKYLEDFHSLVKSKLTWDSYAEVGHQVKHDFPLLVVAARKK